AGATGRCGRCAGKGAGTARTSAPPVGRTGPAHRRPQLDPAGPQRMPRRRGPVRLGCCAAGAWPTNGVTPRGPARLGCYAAGARPAQPRRTRPAPPLGKAGGPAGPAYSAPISFPLLATSGSVHEARLKQQGRRLPLRSLSIETSTRRARVSGFLVDPTQRTHSQRAIGVIDSQVCARSGAASKAALRSSGTSGSGQVEAVVKVKVRT